MYKLARRQDVNCINNFNKGMKKGTALDAVPYVFYMF